MIAFDTDVLTDILLGKQEYVERAGTIPVGQQAVPIVVVEELVRGRACQSSSGDSAAVADSPGCFGFRQHN
ncbi:MAG TPA: hypothetical protein VML55_00395 [Planctomycetaceae bacterium]|nr:hypothetical protein [Planctomycetaceae bacterium]